MELITTEGDLLDQKVDVIVNSWNRNLIPWWLLLPQGVSGAIRRRAGMMPFIELGRHGVLPLGGAVMTGAGRLSYKGIIHVAGIGHTWTSTENSVRLSVRNALALAGENGIRSIAFPLIGTGTGGMDERRVEAWMMEEVGASAFTGKVVIVRYRR